MSNNFRVLFVITARGGSKGLPGKNLREIGGLSLIGYKANSAQSCKYCNRVVISSDDNSIINEANKYGVEAPFIRPKSLATDQASSDSVISHLIEWIEEKENDSYDAIMLLEPSSPFATNDHYTKAIELFIEKKASLVLGVREIEIPSVFASKIEDNNSISDLVEKIGDLNSSRRQDQKPEVTPNGALYLISWEEFKKTQKIYSNPKRSYGLLMSRLNSIEIETSEDLAYARFLVSNDYLDINDWLEVKSD
ncbi:MAG: acylneuraminate cytidylyltransferase family protein [Pseudomonadota bacterium]|nr:acylneuraminate cytidylyltransferase family protein [Pseudomonadota bacterium]